MRPVSQETTELKFRAPWGWESGRISTLQISRSSRSACPGLQGASERSRPQQIAQPYEPMPYRALLVLVIDRSRRFGTECSCSRFVGGSNRSCWPGSIRHHRSKGESSGSLLRLQVEQLSQAYLLFNPAVAIEELLDCTKRCLVQFLGTPQQPNMHAKLPV